MGSSLGQRLRALRMERGLSQADLAGDLVSPSYVSLIEADRRSPEREVLTGLAHRLGCSSLYLETGTVPEEINEQRLQLQFAEIALANGELAQAHDRFRAMALQASSEVRHGAIWGLARTEEALGNLHEAVTHLEALLEAARAGEPGAPSLLNLLIGRCRIYRLAGDFARSIEVGEDAVREVRELGLEGTEDEIRLASSLVGSYFARGDMFSAQHLVSRVIERAEKLGSRQAQGNAYWNASIVAAARGQLTDALDLAAKTLALLAETSPDRSLAGHARHLRLAPAALRPAAPGRGGRPAGASPRAAGGSVVRPAPGELRDRDGAIGPAARRLRRCREHRGARRSRGARTPELPRASMLRW